MRRDEIIRKQGSGSFLKKTPKKLFSYDGRLQRRRIWAQVCNVVGAPIGSELFCFFVSKKNVFLTVPYL
jgi:hypothetical protein